MKPKQKKKEEEFKIKMLFPFNVQIINIILNQRFFKIRASIYFLSASRLKMRKILQKISKYLKTILIILGNEKRCTFNSILYLGSIIFVVIHHFFDIISLIERRLQDILLSN